MHQLRKLFIKSKSTFRQQNTVLRLLTTQHLYIAQQSRFTTNLVQPNQRVAVDSNYPKPRPNISDRSNTSKSKSLNTQQDVDDHPANAIIKIPPNINTHKLSRLFNIGAQDILRKIQTLSKEVYTDEFQILSKDCIELAAIEFEKEIEFIEDPEILKHFKPRPPIVTIMGHVDHGKTTLLDSFRHSQRVKEEYGEITQSIGAFTIITDSQHEVTFIDTPGHEAFQNLRMRGAKVTDIIILVISAIESVQPQTIEVIELARNLRIPVIVAINKIDRPAADVEAVLLDLSAHNLVPEELGGDIICVPISAKMKTNLDVLEQKIIDLSQKKLHLLEDYSMKAQCFVIESNFDEKSTQITATVVVKKGTLKIEDTFVCGIHEGRVRFMINDQGKQVKQAFPGQAVLVGGFKTYPEVGNPLYAVTNHDEAQFIVKTVKARRDREEAATRIDPTKKFHELQKQVGKYTPLERRKIAGGDKIIFYEKLGLVEEKDIEVYRKKLGIAKNVNLDLVDIDELLAEKDAVSGKKKKGGYGQAKKDFDKEEFKKLIQKHKEEKVKLQQMDEEEQIKYNMEKAILKEAFRNEEIKHFPIIIKAATAGVLETLLQETEKLTKGIYRINIIDYSVGPLSEADITSASQTGAIILGFDVPVSPNVAKMADPSKVIVRMHKIIYKFLEDVSNFVHDVKLEIAQEQGKAVNVEVVGLAQVGQIFNIKGAKGHGNKMAQVAGCKVNEGQIQRKLKFRIVRNEQVIADNLKLHSLKKFQEDVTEVDKGMECGVCIDNFDGEYQPGDFIECYKEIDVNSKKFVHKPGIHTTY